LTSAFRETPLSGLLASSPQKAPDSEWQYHTQMQFDRSLRNWGSKKCAAQPQAEKI